MKRIVPLLLALSLVLCCLPGLAVEGYAVEYGTGFQMDSSSNTNANAYWANFDIYTAANSVSAGFLLTCYSNSRYYGVYVDSSFAYPVLIPGYISSLSPFTSLNYPLGTFYVHSAKAVSAYGAIYLNYSDAYSAWLLSGSGTRYFLTEESYLSIPVSTSSPYRYSCYFNELGAIAADGTVTFGHVFKNFYYEKTSNYEYFYGLYPTESDDDDDSGTTDITANLPTFSTDLDGGYWHYLGQNTDGPTLTVNAEPKNSGSITYQWHIMDSLNNTSTSPLGETSASITVDTSELGYYMYWCSATETLSDGSQYTATSTPYCVAIVSSGGTLEETISWSITDDGILIISGSGDMPGFGSTTNPAPWREYSDLITSVVINEGITGIGDYAFYKMGNIVSVSLPQSLVHIDQSSFNLCSGLASINFPASLVSIGRTAFGNCSALTSVVIPSSVQVIGAYAFAVCKNVTSFDFSSSAPPSLGEKAFNLCSKAYLYVPYGLGELYKSADVWADYADIIIEKSSGKPVDEQINDKLDDVQDSMDDISDQLGDVGDKIDESNSWLSGIADGITSLPDKIMEGIKGLFIPDADAMAAQQEKWSQLLVEHFGAVYDSVEILDEIADAFSLQDVQEEIEFPSVAIPLAGEEFVFGGWMVDVVPDGFEFLIEVLKKVVDIVCTIAFVQAMRNKYDNVLGGRA